MTNVGMQYEYEQSLKNMLFSVICSVCLPWCLVDLLIAFSDMIVGS